MRGEGAGRDLGMAIYTFGTIKSHVPTTLFKAILIRKIVNVIGDAHGKIGIFLCSYSVCIPYSLTKDI